MNAGPDLGPLTPASPSDPWREDANPVGGIVDLPAEAERALATARNSPHGKGTRVLWTGPNQRLVVIALTQGSELAPHNSPPAASLQGLIGTTRLYVDGGTDSWTVGAGQVVAIPPDRHGVQAPSDCAFLLTVSLVP